MTEQGFNWTKERSLNWVTYLPYTEAERSILARCGIVLLRGGNLNKTLTPPTKVTFYSTAAIFNPAFWQWFDERACDPPEDAIDGFFRREMDAYCKEMGIPNPATIAASPTPSNESDTTNDETEGGCNV